MFRWSRIVGGILVRRQYCAPTRSPDISNVRRVIRQAFGKYLLWTNTASSGLLMFVGDLIQQELEYQQKMLTKRYDYDRLWNMTVVGFALGPLHHYYYSWLSWVMPDRRLWTVAKKILLDQFFMSPVCIVSFFYGVTMLEGKTFHESTKELKEKFIEIYTVDWAVWPPAQFINFYIVPDRFQVIYINSITTLYNVFLSYIKHRRAMEEEEEKEIEKTMEEAVAA